MMFAQSIRCLPLALFAVLGFFCLTCQSAHADEPRHALVVGNSEYDIGFLKNPVNDARSIAAVLLESGFAVTLVENATGAELDSKVKEFLAALPSGSVGLFYYAGHAVQKDGRNYLLPVDVSTDSAQAVIDQSLSASELVNSFHDAGVAFSIVILDSCRDNPFVSENTELGRGLASMESQGGETLIGFATQAGYVAYDGTGPNSPYTGALITAMEQEGRDILDVFRSVRRSVRVWTNGKQRPFISASIERNFEFRRKQDQQTEPIDIGTLTVERVRPVVEKIWWAAIRSSKVSSDYRDFALSFPNSSHVELARNIAVDLEKTGTQVRGLTLVQFSLDPERRAPLGLSSEITNCDISAGDPDDPQRITDGVAWGLVNVRRALRDCSAALAEAPSVPRLQHQMGRILDIADRYDEADPFYRLAGQSNYSAALVNLGFLYVTGKGRDRDYPQTMSLYRKAAALGNLRARTNIGEMFQLGWSVDSNLDEAVLWYRLAAQNGWPNALDTLANLYRRGKDDNGSGLEKDPREAVRLYKIAAELGNTNAMNNLGNIYLKGDLGSVDIAAALPWFSQASEQGNRYAPFQLARLYRDGKHIKRDYVLALKLFERSADLGFAPARIYIGRMYQAGQGVKKDKLEAGFYFTLASLTADKKRPKQRQEAEDRLAKLSLSRDELTQLRQRAEEWVRLNGG